MNQLLTELASSLLEPFKLYSNSSNREVIFQLFDKNKNKLPESVIYLIWIHNNKHYKHSSEITK